MRGGARRRPRGRHLPVAAEGVQHLTVELDGQHGAFGWASARQRSAPSSIRATRPRLSPTTHRICPPLATAVTAPSALFATGASVATQTPSRHAPQRRSAEATTKSRPTHQPLTAAAAPVENVVEAPLSTSSMTTELPPPPTSATRSSRRVEREPARRAVDAEVAPLTCYKVEAPQFLAREAGEDGISQNADGRRRGRLRRSDAPRGLRGDGVAQRPDARRAVVAARRDVSITTAEAPHVLAGVAPQRRDARAVARAPHDGRAVLRAGDDVRVDGDGAPAARRVARARPDFFRAHLH